MDIRKQIGEELLLFDGAMGTMLQKYGMKAGQNPEALNLEDPELLSRIHREYVEAGAQFITTNTFGANAYKLQETGYSVDGSGDCCRRNRQSGNGRDRGESGA